MFELVFTYIPQHILLAKLIRPGTESTMMGLSYSMLLLNHNVLRDLGGAFINETWIGVDNKNLDLYWICIIISTSCMLIPITYIYFVVPSNEECDRVQAMYSQVQINGKKKDDESVEDEIDPQDTAVNST